jgi:hypothetical protein
MTQNNVQQNFSTVHHSEAIAQQQAPLAHHLFQLCTYSPLSYPNSHYIRILYCIETLIKICLITRQVSMYVFFEIYAAVFISTGAKLQKKMLLKRPISA